MGRPLPKYEEYKEKLAAYCEACEIEIEYRDHDNDGSWIPSKRKIALDKDLDESTEIATLLHEIGHSTDDSLHDPKTGKILNRAYVAYYKEKATQKQKELVLECERKAWFYGRGVAKKLRIRLGKWYTEEEMQALRDYGEVQREIGSGIPSVGESSVEVRKQAPEEGTGQEGQES